MPTGTQPCPELDLPLWTRLKIAVFHSLTDSDLRSDGTINRSRSNLLHRRIPPSSTPKKGVRSHDVVVDASRNLSFRLYIPTSRRTTSSASSLPVIVYFHGGGFCFWSAAYFPYDSLCRRFARKFDAVVVSVDYRLAPEHKFPSQFDDGFVVLKFIDENRKSIESWPENADVGRCFLAGDSAGGNLAHNLAVRVCQEHLGEAKLGDVKLTGLVLLQPFFGGVDRVESEIRIKEAPILSVAKADAFWTAFLPDGVDRDHWAVNVSGPDAVDLSGLDFPPVIMFVGGFDPLRDWQLRYHDWLKGSGHTVSLVDIPTVFHGFYGFPEMPECSKVVMEIKDFIDKHAPNAAQ
ncbi:hypothetical protein Dimus_021584 [Dionaea muscipula]